MSPIGVGGVITKGMEQTGGELYILLPYQQIDVCHGPLSRAIESERIQRGALQRDGRDAAGASRIVDLLK